MCSCGGHYIYSYVPSEDNAVAVSRRDLFELSAVAVGAAVLLAQSQSSASCPSDRYTRAAKTFEFVPSAIHLSATITRIAKQGGLDNRGAPITLNIITEASLYIPIKYSLYRLHLRRGQQRRLSRQPLDCSNGDSVEIIASEFGLR